MEINRLDFHTKRFITIFNIRIKFISLENVRTDMRKQCFYENINLLIGLILFLELFSWRRAMWTAETRKRNVISSEMCPTIKMKLNEMTIQRNAAFFWKET